MSVASERANGRASGPVLTSRLLFVPDHSAAALEPPPPSVNRRRRWDVNLRFPLCVFLLLLLFSFVGEDLEGVVIVAALVVVVVVGIGWSVTEPVMAAPAEEENARCVQ